MSAKGGFLPVRLRAAMRGTGHSVHGRVGPTAACLLSSEPRDDADINVRRVDRKLTTHSSP